MNCKSCGKKLERGWKFCPYCGEERKFLDIFKKKYVSPEQEMEKMMKLAQGFLKMAGIPVKMNIRFNNGQQHINPPMAVKQKMIKMPIEEQIPKKVKEIIEPNTKKTKITKGTKYVLFIPGVMSPKNVKIRQFKESIEIKAYAKNKAFFKVIAIKPKSQIVEKKYQDEMLKIVVA